jgi:hypothetical protein
MKEIADNGRPPAMAKENVGVKVRSMLKTLTSLKQYLE